MDSNVAVNIEGTSPSKWNNENTIRLPRWNLTFVHFGCERVECCFDHICAYRRAISIANIKFPGKGTCVWKTKYCLPSILACYKNTFPCLRLREPSGGTKPFCDFCLFESDTKTLVSTVLQFESFLLTCIQLKFDSKSLAIEFGNF